MPRPSAPFVEGELTSSIIGSMYAVHRELGFGFRESLYATALERDLIAKGHRVIRELAVTVFFRGEPLGFQVLDMVVDDKVVAEIKSTKILHPSASSQLFGYLAATKYEVGLVLHFGQEAKAHRVLFENQFKRIKQPGITDLSSQGRSVQSL
jgi:GxxExxY protein